MKKTESKQMDRYQGAIIGVATGDALGAPLEFMRADEIRRTYGGSVREMVGGGWLSVEPGEVTDDTQMTLAVAEGIVAGKTQEEIYTETGANFMLWYSNAPKDIGMTCAAVISAMCNKTTNGAEEWLEESKILYSKTNGKTAGNGALMRTIYPALYYHNTEEAEQIASRIGYMTHWHEASDIAVRLYTRAVNKIVNSDMDETAAKAKVEEIMAPIRQRAKYTENRPTGYSIDSLICAINAIRDTETFEDALIYAVNLGGDADTIGAITGGLAGAIYGAEQIPVRWTVKLANKPNKKTAAMFLNKNHSTTDCSEYLLLTRLVDLSYIAFNH